MGREEAGLQSASSKREGTNELPLKYSKETADRFSNLV